MRVDLEEGIEAVAVREREVEQHHARRLRGEVLKTLREPADAIEFEQPVLAFGQHLPDEADVPRIVLDQQNPLAFGHVSYFPFGSVTTVSQKLSIDCTTLMNCSRSTGLVT